jgi:hypothetical protein
MQIPCCIAALLLVGATAFARIGETEAQIQKRYGKPTSSSPWTKGYFYNGFFIIVTFDNGVSGIETYEKRNGAPMSPVEIRQLLDANGDGTKWQEPTRNGFASRYEGKSRFAEYNAVTNTLTIADDAAVHRINARNRSLGVKKAESEE